jgi:hypothetical protein
MLFAILFIQIMAFFHFSQSDRILNMNMNLNNIGKLKISGYRGQHDEAVIKNAVRSVIDIFENRWNKNH